MQLVYRTLQDEDEEYGESMMVYDYAKITLYDDSNSKQKLKSVVTQLDVFHDKRL
jgi:hypothetical protein